MAEKTTTVKLNSKQIKQLEKQLNDVAKSLGFEIFDFWISWAPNEEKISKENFAVYEMNAIFRKLGWKQRKETPEDAKLYQEHAASRKQRQSQPSA